MFSDLLFLTNSNPRDTPTVISKIVVDVCRMGVTLISLSFRMGVLPNFYKGAKITICCNILYKISDFKRRFN